jgi:hypothetical protein
LRQIRENEESVLGNRTTGCSDEEEVRKFNSVCAQICRAQKGLAEAAAQKKWQEYVARNKAWTKYQIKFGCKIGALTIGLAVSIATAAVTGGTTVIAVMNEPFIAKRDPKLGSLKNVVDYASEASEVVGLAKAVVDLAQALA